jgi:hypothetical protein
MATITLHDILTQFRDEDLHRLSFCHAVVPTCCQIARCMVSPWMKNPSARDVLCAGVSREREKELIHAITCWDADLKWASDHRINFD